MLSDYFLFNLLTFHIAIAFDKMDNHPFPPPISLQKGSFRHFQSFLISKDTKSAVAERRENEGESGGGPRWHRQRGQGHLPLQATWSGTTRGSSLTPGLPKAVAVTPNPLLFYSLWNDSQPPFTALVSLFDRSGLPALVKIQSSFIYSQ